MQVCNDMFSISNDNYFTTIDNKNEKINEITVFLQIWFNDLKWKGRGLRYKAK